MELILTADVSKLGKKGDVVKVSDGYASNFLLPKGLAKVMNNQSKKELQDAINAKNYHRGVDRQQAANIASQINGKTITLNLKHGETGKLYGAVTNKAVTEKIREVYSVNIDKKKIFFEGIGTGNIKSAGSYNIKIKLFDGIEASMELIVQ